MNVLERIEAQQKGKEGQPAFMVGEQLKDICRREPESAELVEQDLEAVTLEDVAAKIKARADEIHNKEKGSCVHHANGGGGNHPGSLRTAGGGGAGRTEIGSDAEGRFPGFDGLPVRA